MITAEMLLISAVGFFFIFLFLLIGRDIFVEFSQMVVIFRVFLLLTNRSVLFCAGHICSDSYFVFIIIQSINKLIGFNIINLSGRHSDYHGNIFTRCIEAQNKMTSFATWDVFVVVSFRQFALQPQPERK